MASYINLKVRWTAPKRARTVTVRFEIQPVALFKVADAGDRIQSSSRKPPLDPLNFESKQSLLTFLADLTRAQRDGGTVTAVCLDDDIPDVLRLLDIQGEPPDPIPVDLPPDA